MQSYTFFEYHVSKFPFFILKKELFSDIYQMVNPRNRKILCKFASDNMLYNVRNDRDRQ